MSLAMLDTDLMHPLDVSVLHNNSFLPLAHLNRGCYLAIPRVLLRWRRQRWDQGRKWKNTWG